jgi:hypothetical protein
MTRPLTTKQAKFVKAKAEGKTGVQAAKEAYGVTDYNTAAVVASENLKKPNIQEALQTEFAKQGITLEKIVKPIADALDATKIVTSPTEPDKEVADHPTRLKASNMATQFLGLNKNNDAGPSIHFHQHAEDQRQKYGI